MTAFERLPLRSFRHCIVVAGAGMSAECGLPTFLKPAAVWGAEEGSAAHMALVLGTSPLALFRQHPEHAWRMYLSRLAACSAARIHNGYLALLDITRMLPGDCAVLTSNVDGIFRRAGFPLVHECHGQIIRLQCGHPCVQQTWPADLAGIAQDLARGVFPTCPHCGGAARPNISWGDSAFVHGEEDVRARIFAASIEAMRGPTLVIECGVAPVSGLRRFAENLHVQRDDVFLLRINPEAEAGAENRQLTMPIGAEAALVALLHAFTSA